MKIYDLAAICHNANGRLCQALGDRSQTLWGAAPQWQKDSCIAGVKLHLRDPSTTPEQSHEAWMAHKTAEGWTWGPVKNAGAKQHPCMVPYAELPPEQQAKDHLFKAIVNALAPLVEDLEPEDEEVTE